MTLKYNILLYYMQTKEKEIKKKEDFKEYEIPGSKQLIEKLKKDDGTNTLTETDVVYVMDERINTTAGGARNNSFWKGTVKYIDNTRPVCMVIYESSYMKKIGERPFTQENIKTTNQKEKVTIYKVEEQPAAQQPNAVGGGTKRKRRRNKKSKRRYKRKIMS